MGTNLISAGTDFRRWEKRKYQEDKYYFAAWNLASTTSQFTTFQNAPM